MGLGLALEGKSKSSRSKTDLGICHAKNSEKHPENKTATYENFTIDDMDEKVTGRLLRKP